MLLLQQYEHVKKPTDTDCAYGYGTNMEAKPFGTKRGIFGLIQVRLDDRPERYFLHIALRSSNGEILLRDRPLWAYLGAIADGPYPQSIVATTGQLGRIVTSLDELVALAQQETSVDAEIDLLTAAEILRPFSKPSGKR